MIIDSPTALTFEAESRTIRGLAVPYGRAASASNTPGIKWQFAKGVLDWVGAKLLIGHKWADAIGTADFTETDEGLQLDAGRVARTARGDEGLELAATGTYSGLSIGLADDVKYVERDGVRHVTKGTVREVSITPIPAFTDAAIRSVAASADNQEVPMKCTTCGQVHADGVTECQTIPPAFSADEGKALTDQLGELTKKVDGLADIKIPIPGATGAQFEVREKQIYRFDGTLADSGHDFSTDLIAAVCEGDKTAGKRVIDFANDSIMNPAGALEFMVDQADTAAVNPAKYRPDMFKDEAPPLPSPLYDTFYAGAVADNTPFFYSKLGTYDLGTKPHTEGQEPAEGSFNTVTGATITPALESGRFGLTREVIDQGGNPQVSGMIWNKVLRTHRLKLEAIAATVLKSKVASYGELATIAAGAGGAAIGRALKGGLVDLRYTADGQRFTKFFAAKALYKALSEAEETVTSINSEDEVITTGTGRPLYPILSPSNADGTTASGLGSINVAGIKLDPTWSTSPQDNSFYADPQAVKVWNSGLSRLDRVKETAAGYFVDFWFYAASHVYDESGVLKFAYSEE